MLISGSNFDLRLKDRDLGFDLWLQNLWFAALQIHPARPTQSAFEVLSQDDHLEFPKIRGRSRPQIARLLCDDSHKNSWKLPYEAMRKDSRNLWAHGDETCS